MRLLLDTNALIWATVAPMALPPSAAAAIEDSSNTIFVAAASAWEIGTKVRLGKLPLAFHLEQDLLGYVTRAGYSWLDMTAEIALRAARLTADHRDPFDRLIAAYALAEDMPVISSDSKLELFGVRRLW